MASAFEEMLPRPSDLAAATDGGPAPAKPVAAAVYLTGKTKDPRGIKSTPDRTVKGDQSLEQMATAATAKSVTKDIWAHRHYHAIHPCNNKLLAKRWEDKARDLHQNRLKLARASIDDSPPRVYPHLEMRLKKNKIEEERLADIERKNHILLARIAFQMKKHVDLSDLPMSPTFSSSSSKQPPAISRGPTPKRKRDLAKIYAENLTILQRIEDKAPNYNRLEWLCDRRRNLGYLYNISEYPQAYLKLLTEGEAEFDLLKVASRPPYQRRLPIKSTAAGSITVPAVKALSKSSLSMTGRPVTRGEPKVGPLSETDASEIPTQQAAGISNSLDEMGLGIVEISDASSTTKEKTGDGSSRPSSGWSGFDQAEPSEPSSEAVASSDDNDLDETISTDPALPPIAQTSSRPITAHSSRREDAATSAKALPPVVAAIAGPKDNVADSDQEQRKSSEQQLPPLQSSQQQASSRPTSSSSSRFRSSRIKLSSGGSKLVNEIKPE